MDDTRPPEGEKRKPIAMDELMGKFVAGMRDKLRRIHRLSRRLASKQSQKSQSLRNLIEDQSIESPDLKLEDYLNSTAKKSDRLAIEGVKIDSARRRTLIDAQTL